MTKVLIIDSNDQRGSAIRQLIGSEQCSETRTVPMKVFEQSIVFIHASDDRQAGWRNCVKELCSDKWVVMYGGDGVTEELLTQSDPEIDLSKNDKWFAVEEAVGDTPETTEWHPREFVDAIEEGKSQPQRLTSILSGFDPILEAKLNLLHACLGGFDAVAKFQQGAEEECTKTQELGWTLLRDIQLHGSTKKVHELLEDVQRGGQITSEKLRELRDGLLPD